MAITGRTLFRFCGALVLGFLANRIDRPRPRLEVAPRSLETEPMPGVAATGIEMSIAPGMRAMSIPIRSSDGLGGVMGPNERVDVLLIQRSGERRTATLIEPNLRVLAVGASPQRDAVGAPAGPSLVATIEVTPALAVRLATAGTRGEFALLSHTPGANGGPILRRRVHPESVSVRVKLGASPP